MGKGSEGALKDIHSDLKELFGPVFLNLFLDHLQRSMREDAMIG